MKLRFDAMPVVEVDEELYRRVKDAANREGTSVGELVSSLLRHSLPDDSFLLEDGIPVFTPTPERPPTDLEFVNRLRDGDD